MIDLAIITAIPEEYEAVLEILQEVMEPMLPPRNPVLFGWRIGYLPSGRHDSPYSVALAMCTSQTQVPSSLATYLTVNEFRPRYVIFCGIAGGLNPPNTPKEELLRLGDITISTGIWGYEYGKVDKDGLFHPRPDLMFRPDQGLKQAAELFGKINKSWQQRVQQSVAGAGVTVSHVPHTIAGPVASGDKVVDNPDAEFFQAVLKHWPKLRGVEMEGAGAAAAVEQLAAQGILTGFLMIRGISDLPRVDRLQDGAGTSERDLWKRAAARAAAAFVASFVADGWPIAPLGELDDQPSISEQPPQDEPGDPTHFTRSNILAACEERVLFYMADRELQEASDVHVSRNLSVWAERLRLEFRLIFLAMNLEGEVVMPPSYFLESSLCRDLVHDHLPLVHAGYFKLLVDRPSLHEYLENKQTRYAKAQHFEVYYNAYYSTRDFHGIRDIPFLLTDKATSVGRKTLITWHRSMLGRIQKYPRFVSRARRFLDLSARTEKSAILYENIRENQKAAGLANDEVRYLDVRSTLNRHYLMNYVRLGFTVPERSVFVWSGLTRQLPRSGFDLVALARTLTELRLHSRLLMADTATLLKWRANPAVRAFFLAARQLLLKGQSLTDLFTRNGTNPLTQLDAALS